MKTRNRACCLVLLVPLSAAADEEPAARLVEDAVDRAPLHTVVPVYPEKARRARVEGEVEVCFTIDRHGRTRSVAVRRSTNRVFEKPARNAGKASTFEPLGPGEEVPAIKNCRTFRFNLERVAVD